MAALFPFRALRPASEAAAHVASVPYDVVTTAEARALAADDPLSFLHVTRAEIDLPPQIDPYDSRVYAQAVKNFESLKREAPLLLDPDPALFVYRLGMGAHEQAGIAGCFSLDDYASGVIKKHERTRTDKEDDRTRHMLELRAQTGVVFLTYVASTDIDRLAARVMTSRPLYDFVAPDSVSHAIWTVAASDVPAFVEAFGRLPALYIADGHHRAASAARARAALDPSAQRQTEASRFVAVAFPDTSVQILPYNRVVRDRAGRTPEALLEAVREQGLQVAEGGTGHVRKGEVGMFLTGRWYTVALPPPAPGASRTDALDVARLQHAVLEPILGIRDIRTDPRIDFVGGARGTAELERQVSSGEAAVAFSLHPVDIGELIAIADAGAIMPPKSTWFEPKLRDGLLVHLI